MTPYMLSLSVMKMISRLSKMMLSSQEWMMRMMMMKTMTTTLMTIVRAMTVRMTAMRSTKVIIKLQME